MIGHTVRSNAWTMPGIGIGCLSRNRMGKAVHVTILLLRRADLHNETRDGKLCRFVVNEQFVPIQSF